MKNIMINDNDDNDIESILENETLPISINNEIVVLDYNEYINLLKILDPQKAEQIEKDIKKTYENPIECFTDCDCCISSKYGGYGINIREKEFCLKHKAELELDTDKNITKPCETCNGVDFNEDFHKIII